ncbi:MAG: leucine-rich repeat domain-containing protein [Oscillospiraceae bacterium]|nr:leucine-rich repeat domain-containing protein [Oscillospiraceae bacterium]
MATADSVKTKLQGLIDTANATTGKEDATLTAALNSLIGGFGSGGGGNAEAYLAMINGTDIPDGGGKITIPEGVTRVPNSLYSALPATIAYNVILPSTMKRLGQSAFSQLAYSMGSNGASVVFNDGLESIGATCFSRANRCVFMNIPNSLVDIGAQAFSNACSNASISAYSEDLHFPEMKTIGASAFSGFRFEGAQIHIGSKIESIGASAFAFYGSPAFTLTIDRAEGTVEGAPWGATNATIVWEGDA